MAARVEVGILLPTREAVMSGRVETAPLLAMAEDAEAEGYHSVWVGDSILARPRFEPLTLLAAVAARTKRVALGTAVLLPALRHPVVLAHAVATLDRISAGRLILGVGIAPDSPATRREFEACGVPFSQRAGRTEETIEVCRSLWRSDQVSYRGRYFALEETTVEPKPHRSGGPAVWIGGETEGALRRAGRLGDGWFPISATAEAFGQGLARVRAIMRELGRDPDALTPGYYATVNINPDRRQAESELRRFVEAYYGVPYERMAAGMGCVAGPSEACLEWLAGFVTAGARHLVLRFAGPDQTAQLRAASRDLLPRLIR